MIVGDELRRWATRPGARGFTEATINAWAETWNNGPFNRRFAAAMANIEPRNARAITDIVCELFKDDDWIDALLDGLAEVMRRDPFIIPPFRNTDSEIHKGLLVFEDENVAVAAGLTNVVDLAAKKSARRGKASISFSGQVEVSKFINAGGTVLSFWEVPQITPDFTAANAGECVHTGKRRIENGEVLVIDGRYQSFVIEHAETNSLMVQASVKLDRAPVSVEYDADNHRYLGCSAADDSASRIQMITTLLRRLDCAAAFPVVVEFLDHPSFFVRWHVMRELLGLDAQAALPYLKKMAEHDPHPEPRRAARAVLDRFEKSMSAGREAA